MTTLNVLRPSQSLVALISLSDLARLRRLANEILEPESGYEPGDREWDFACSVSRLAFDNRYHLRIDALQVWMCSRLGVMQAKDRVLVSRLIWKMLFSRDGNHWLSEVSEAEIDAKVAECVHLIETGLWKSIDLGPKSTRRLHSLAIEAQRAMGDIDTEEETEFVAIPDPRPLKSDP